MPQIDDILAGEIRDLLARVRKLETASIGPLTLDRGRFRITGSGSMLFDASGLLTINGTCNGSGAWTWTGTTTLNGPVNIAGTQTTTGILNQNGTWNLAGTGGITGAVSCTGNWTWTGNLTVNSPGSIVVGGTIPMTIANAAVSFSSGGKLIGYSGGIKLVSGSTPDLTVSTGGHYLYGHATTSSAANVVLDSVTGLLSRITSARRFKIDPQPLNLPDALLDVPVKAWIDKGARERGEPDLRIPGVIAEEVEAAGGEAFVTYDGDGDIESVAYDRLAIARTQILAEQLGRAMQTIADQGQTIAAITEALSRITGLLEQNGNA